MPMKKFHHIRVIHTTMAMKKLQHIRDIPNPNNPVVIFHSLSIASLTVATADRGR